ncbi:hypothetical protein M513_05410 [Trichuris suis]|uniref:Uncharacterized protein n=1 Tax=Trichuris suis TaxID=68888 RepID=A0A085M909_9BILA|nr:hypothetical protein M513_05410 [Trichuris suis]
MQHYDMRNYAEDYSLQRLVGEWAPQLPAQTGNSDSIIKPAHQLAHLYRVLLIAQHRRHCLSSVRMTLTSESSGTEEANVQISRSPSADSRNEDQVPRWQGKQRPTRTASCPPTITDADCFKVSYAPNEKTTCRSLIGNCRRRGTYRPRSSSLPTKMIRLPVQAYPLGPSSNRSKPPDCTKLRENSNLAVRDPNGPPASNDTPNEPPKSKVIGEEIITSNKFPGKMLRLLSLKKSTGQFKILCRRSKIADYWAKATACAAALPNPNWIEQFSTPLFVGAVVVEPETTFQPRVNTTVTDNAPKQPPKEEQNSLGGTLVQPLAAKYEGSDEEIKELSPESVETNECAQKSG